MGIGRDPEEWTSEQRAALASDIDRELEEVLERMGRLGRSLAEETVLFDYLKGRQRRHRLEEEGLPF